MNVITLVWIALPLFVGFSIYLLPKLARILALLVSLGSLAYGLWQTLAATPLTLELLDSFGVTLVSDSLSGFFVLTNALVTAAVVIYCWHSNKSAFFYTQVIILHGSVNAVFICADFISLYVALEVIGIAAFLLIAYPRTDRSIWVALRYLFVSNTAMLFYLIGAVLVYQSSHSFAYAGLQQAPAEAIALLFLGVLSKGGIFISGLWLPLTHAESETPVSAMLSGIVVKAGVFPLIRWAMIVGELEPIIEIFSAGTAILGTSCAILEKDTKRMLAWSTISQMGFVIAAPAVAGFYALTHGVAKAALFLTVGQLPSRSFQELKQQPIHTHLWIVLMVASLSISGFPLLAGFNAKASTLQQLGSSWHGTVMNVVAVGTVIAFARFIFLPFRDDLGESHSWKVPAGFWLAVTLLIGVLMIASGLHSKDYTFVNLTKSLSKIGIGWIIYYFCFKDFVFQRQLPQAPENLDHLIGTMSLTLIVLFWLALP